MMISLSKTIVKFVLIILNATNSDISITVSQLYELIEKIPILMEKVSSVSLNSQEEFDKGDVISDAIMLKLNCALIIQENPKI